jgi:hypothetical protein
VDRDTTPPALPLTAAAAITALGNINTTTYTIPNLQSLTSYDYYLTAIDVFGNESISIASRAFGAVTPSANPWDAITTPPFTATVKITDSITTYEDSSFTANIAASTRPLAENSIKIEVYIVGATQPDSLNVILADNAFGDLVTASTLNGTLDTDYYRIALSKTSPNTWAGFISSENSLITIGQECKFILEAIQSGAPIYYDHDADYDAAEAIVIDPNDYEWTFNIIAGPKVTPWPTRVLNNVITDKNPRAYPAYYLTDDAIVTIKAYDIKGRPVATLLDGAPRKSGQNIKENGWAGTNKSGRKLGVGLYYIHIKAKRTSDGAVIIDNLKSCNGQMI